MAFIKGKSGNPRGRPRGVEDKRVQHRKLFEQHAEELVKRAIEMALNGDSTAMRLCLERVTPPCREAERPVLFGDGAERPAELARKIVAGMARGEVSPVAAASALHALATQARVLEADELEHRVAALEGSQQ